MATKKKAKKTARTAPKTPKKKTPPKGAKRKAAPKKRKQVAKKHGAPKQTKPAKRPAIPRPKAFAEKLRDANARIDVHGDDMADEADRTGEADEREVGDAEEVEGEGDGTSEQE